ncbi:MAG: DUF202 domain-containing protein [Legionellales bacterium]|nr:DUF202 domain-containing protein [Legionellales bacterium]
MTTTNESDPLPIKEALTDNATMLAVVRTRLAAERTLMSWIRTAFSMITFGFGLIKFFQYLKSDLNIPQNSHFGLTNQLGLFLILLGTLSLIPGMIEHQTQLARLHKFDGGDRWNYALIVAILVALIGMYIFLSVLF